MPDPSFDTWTIVFLFAAIQGYFVGFVLLQWKRGNRQANRLLAAILVLFAFTMCEYVLYWTNYLYAYIHMANLSTQLPFLLGPLMWFYLRTIYTQKNWSKNDLWHLAPFLLALIVYWPWLSLDAESKTAITLGQEGFPINRYVLRALLWTRIAHLFAYGAWNYVYIWRQPRVGETRKWASILNGFYIGFALAYTSYYVLIRFSFFNTSWDYHISAVMTAFIYLIAYAGYAQPAVFNGFALVEPQGAVKYRNSSLTPEASHSLLRKLNERMGQERLYRDPDLSLEALAGALNASKHHVSQIINEQLGSSFFEYINALRIEEAKQLLAETSRSDLHIIEAAYAVGFNNKVSFNNAFKKATQMTPTEYRKNHSRTDSSVVQPGAVGER